LALGGCVSGIAGNDANIYNSLNGQRIVGNENSVIVSNVWNEMDAFPLAEQHCKKTVDRRGSARSPVLIPFTHHIERTIYGKDVMDLTIFGLRSM
jgi:hypothetical protein